MKQSPSWEASSSSAVQEILRVLRNTKVLYRINENFQLVPILSHFLASVSHIGGTKLPAAATVCTSSATFLFVRCWQLSQCQGNSWFLGGLYHSLIDPSTCLLNRATFSWSKPNTLLTVVVFWFLAPTVGLACASCTAIPFQLLRLLLIWFLLCRLMPRCSVSTYVTVWL